MRPQGQTGHDHGLRQQQVQQHHGLRQALSPQVHGANGSSIDRWYGRNATYAGLYVAPVFLTGAGHRDRSILESHVAAPEAAGLR